MACYQLVKEHDRVGRMADTQEYENFVVDKARLSPVLLAELQREVPGKLEDLGDRIVIKHLYMERRMTPLNLYLEQANDQQMRDAIEEYGNAIKQLAAANIFPGDMLFKNFGVTRHGRVVFYDYDEICYMTEVNFRDIPPPRYPEDELASEPWYSIAPNDVFRKSSATSCAAIGAFGRCLKSCTAICLRLSIGAGCSSASARGTWKTCSLTARSSGSASAAGGAAGRHRCDVNQAWAPATAARASSVMRA